MSSSARQCPSCSTPLPGEAVFCPRCGAATPTEISLGTGEVRQASSIVAGEEEYRARLGRALGAGYELRDLLGRGGFGAVYVAWDVRLEREVAVKALRPDLFASPQLLERFEREAKAAAKLRHPNILPVYAVGEGEGLAYMVMPRVQGESLRDLLDREETLGIEETRRIVAEAAAGLGAAHEAGIVHRDIKPENIMLEGPERRVLLMDFGIAKSMRVGETGLTATGMIVGTPQYMSPEQATGEREIGPAADLYSLGVVAFQMLTGRLPFEADTLEQLIVARVTLEPPDVRSVRSDVPADLAAAIARCLAKNPRNRWPSASALSVAVTAVSEVPRGLHLRPRRPWRRRPAVVASVGVLGLGVLGLLGYRVVTSRSSPPDKHCLSLVARHSAEFRTTRCVSASFAVVQVRSSANFLSDALRAITLSEPSLGVQSFDSVGPSVYETRARREKADVAMISVAIAESTYVRRLGIVTFSVVPGRAAQVADGFARELAAPGLSSATGGSVDIDSICALLGSSSVGSLGRGACGASELVADDPFQRSDLPSALDAMARVAQRLGLSVREFVGQGGGEFRFVFGGGADSTVAGWARAVKVSIPWRVVVAVAGDSRSRATRILDAIDSAMVGEGRPLRRAASTR